MITCGIDPGLDGAVAFLAADDGLTLCRTPVLAGAGGGKRSFDLAGMKELFSVVTPSLVALEKVGPMPAQGVTSMFRFGQGFGMWEGLLAGLGVPYQVVTPQSWQKAVLAGTARDKRAAIEFVTRRWPAISLLPSSRCRVPHDGFADASCLALYARTLLNGR